VKAKVPPGTTIEVETVDLDQVQEAMDAGAHIIMLDNMTTEKIIAAVSLVDGRSKLEVSGGITHERLAELADTGIDYISSGALTPRPVTGPRSSSCRVVCPSSVVCGSVALSLTSNATPDPVTRSETFPYRRSPPPCSRGSSSYWNRSLLKSLTTSRLSDPVGRTTFPGVCRPYSDVTRASPM
jgi:hypothetical protein